MSRTIKRNFSFFAAMAAVIALGFILITKQLAEVSRTKSKYDQQKAILKQSQDKEQELRNDINNLSNPELFEEIARKNGYRFENEEVVNVTRPITEEDKWK
ncbi:MAG: septum formation initiator family protein [Elusimicrobiales bacterium]|nr:septum formation initiator family protein [Elusimicrobiales bacterium]